MFKQTHYFFKIISICGLIFFISCRSSYVSKPFVNNEIPLKPNYNNEESWAILPSKYTEKLKKLSIDSINKLEADVFYVYPTLITNKKDSRWNVATSDSIQNTKVLNTAVSFQASAWATSGKLYIPFYRQAHIRSYSHLDNGGKEALTLAYEDIKAAFEVYIRKYNNGRPIIIAGHSQGTTHCIMLLKEFFDNKPLQKQLIAAYIPGIGVEKEQFNTIKLMTKPSETGGFVSWNTYKKNKLPKKYDSWYKNKVTSNPITWDTRKFTKRDDHQGFLYSNGKIYDKSLKIEIKDGVIWTTLPRFPHRLFAIFKKSYHVGDVNLFWLDIKKNSELRVKTWLQLPKS
ncbi:MAG: DUF3089 domain-containing protein [Aureibaculum sp.]|nr:DUF3089 domain-containing protein [Aureibaculum sp.]